MTSTVPAFVILQAVLGTGVAIKIGLRESHLAVSE